MDAPLIVLTPRGPVRKPLGHRSIPLPLLIFLGPRPLPTRWTMRGPSHGSSEFAPWHCLIGRTGGGGLISLTFMRSAMRESRRDRLTTHSSRAVGITPTMGIQTRSIWPDIVCGAP
jgi:hypothetical protein